MNKGRKKQIALWCFCMLALIMTGLLGVQVMAASEGDCYIAKATPYYKHPVTGKVEDAGNNEGLGQSMTESVLYKKALIEKTSDGKTYATVRIYLTDNLTDVKIWSQKNSSDTWKKAATTIMQENIGGKYCTDYRFEISDETAIMKMSFYVTPMGRDVIFFFTFSNLKKGSSDFITSVVGETEADPSAQVSSEKDLGTSDKTMAKMQPETTKSNETTREKITEKNENNKSEMAASGEELVAGAEGLVVSDSSYLLENSDTEQVSKSGKGEPESSNDISDDRIYVSWILVLQCIMIITIPSLIILLALSIYFRLEDRRNREWE